MPTTIESNPLFANNPPGYLLNEQFDGWWGLDPNITLANLVTIQATVLPSTISQVPAPGVGVVLGIQGWDGVHSAASGSPTHPTCALGTTGTGLLIGVAQGGTTGGSPVQVVGQSVKTRHFGIGLVLVDGTTTVGHALTVGSTPGVAHDSGGVTGTTNETIGVALQALTVSSGIGIIYAFIKLT